MKDYLSEICCPNVVADVFMLDVFADADVSLESSSSSGFFLRTDKYIAVNERLTFVQLTYKTALKINSHFDHWKFIMCESREIE